MIGYEQTFVNTVLIHPLGTIAIKRLHIAEFGAHHQNSIAERGIKELTLIARTILLHAIH